MADLHYWSTNPLEIIHDATADSVKSDGHTAHLEHRNDFISPVLVMESLEELREKQKEEEELDYRRRRSRRRHGDSKDGGEEEEWGWNGDGEKKEEKMKSKKGGKRRNSSGNKERILRVLDIGGPTRCW